MKKILAAFLIASSSAAMAWGPHEQGLLLGGIIGYMINQDKQPPPVYVQPPVPVQHRVYNLPPQQPVYEESTRYEPACYCYVKVYVQIGWK